MMAVNIRGEYSVRSSQSTLDIVLIINTDINNRAEAVAYEGTMDTRGEKNNDRINRIETVTAVSPVRPPAAIPVPLSI